MRDEDREQWERQFADTEGWRWAGSHLDRAAAIEAATRLNEVVAELGFEVWELEAFPGVLPDGAGVVRLLGSPLAVCRLAWLLEALGRRAPSGAAEGGRGAA